MQMRNRARSWTLRLLAPMVATSVVLVGATPGHAQGRDQDRAEGRTQDPGQPVTGWAERASVSLDTVDPAAPLDDLAHLRRTVGAATIVGLGEATHGTSEITTLKHRTLRFLVEERGFRSIAWEDDWTLGTQLDTYIRTGKGDLPSLLGQMSTAWRSDEVAEVLHWLRDYNMRHRDQVRFVGVEGYATRPLAYNAVDAYVARTAPDQLRELRRHLRVIEPFTTDMGEYVTWYRKVTDKERYIRHARAVHDLVEALPPRQGDRYALTQHHADAILSFYERFSLSFEDNLVHRDAFAAQSVRWWRGFSGDKIAYWAAGAHTANAPDLRVAQPPNPEVGFPSAGSYLRRWYGERYLSIGFTFDHGTVEFAPGQTVTVPPPAPDWFERPFGAVRADHFTLDLRGPAPRPVRDWLAAPIRTRGLVESGHASFMSGGTLAQWYDVIVHRQEVTPVRPA